MDLNSYSKELIENGVVVLRSFYNDREMSMIKKAINSAIDKPSPFKSFTDKSVAIEKQIHLEDGKPMLFGEESLKGLTINKDYSALEIVNLKKNPEDMKYDAISMMEKNQPKAAISLFNKILKQNPEDKDVLLNKGLSLNKIRKAFINFFPHKLKY